MISGKFKNRFANLRLINLIIAMINKFTILNDQIHLNDHHKLDFRPLNVLIKNIFNFFTQIVFVFYVFES